MAKTQCHHNPRITNKPLDRFDAMRVFTRVVERRSFTLAAQDLGLPRSTVTDAVKQLEARLGVQLLQRTPVTSVRPSTHSSPFPVTVAVAASAPILDGSPADPINRDTAHGTPCLPL